jgi:hypothetical protein
MVKKIGYKIFLLSLAYFFIFLGANLAQVITADIYGRVVDIENALLPGANVTLLNTATGFTRSTTTSSDGKYSFKSIPTQGEFSITVELSGFKGQVRKGLTLHPNEAYEIDFKLEMSTIQETVTVVAEAPLVNTKDTTVQQVITEELIQSLPIIGRNYLELAHLAPGVTGYDYWPTTGGQHYWAMNYLVDGGSHFSKMRSAARTYYSGYSIDAIKEVQILNNQFSVEFGEGMSSVNSAITKSGTNEFHGSLFFFERPGEWDEVDFMTKTKAPFDQQQLGFTLGGPLKRDKTHFFISYEYRRQRAHSTVLAPMYFGQILPDKQDEHTIFVKVDHQLTKSDYLTIRYSNDLFDWPMEYGGYSIPGEGRLYVNYVHTGQLAWIKTISESSVNELRVQVASYWDLRTQITNYPDRAREIRVNWATFGPERYAGKGFGATPEITYEIFNKFTTGGKKHFFKFGAFFKYVYCNFRQAPSDPQGLYYFLGPPDKYPTPYYFRQGFALDPNLIEIRTNSWYGGVFFEDEWSVNRKLTLTLGLRYDIDYILKLEGFNAPADLNNIQPRLGLAYDLWGNGKSVFRAGFGLFSQQHLSYHFSKEAFFGPKGQVNLTLRPGDPNFPTYPQGLPGFPAGALLPPRDWWEVADDKYLNPYTIQGTVGFQQEILPHLSFSIDAIYLTVMDGQSCTDKNTPASPTGPRTLAQADATRPIMPTSNGPRNIMYLSNLSRSWYKAINIKLERRASDFTFLLTYTLSKTVDMLNPWSLPQDSRNIEDDKGPGNVDRRHLLKLAFFYNFPFKNIILRGWQLSAIAEILSAAPYTEVYGDDRWGTNLFNARPYGRNNLRGDPAYNFDFSLSRRITIKPIEVELKFDAFNAFNITNYTGFYNRWLDGEKFKKPRSAGPPRKFQLGLHIRF